VDEADQGGEYQAEYLTPIYSLELSGKSAAVVASNERGFIAGIQCRLSSSGRVQMLDKLKSLGSQVATKASDAVEGIERSW
jgi:hypothetical protein